MAEPDSPSRRALSRRALIAGAAGVGGAALVGCRTAQTEAVESPAAGAPTSGVADEPRHLAYFGTHQTGVTAPAQPSGVVAAYDVRTTNAEQLRALLTGLTNESARLVTGMPYEEHDPTRPPSQPGTLGNPPAPANLTVTVALGSTFFDDRFGFADQRPRDLEPMPSFAGDQLNPDRAHGDLLIVVASADPAMDRLALRQLHRATHGYLHPRWSVEVTRTTGRNLLGFNDNVTNPAIDDEGAMDRFVWIGVEDDEPSWTTGGTYAVTRTTRLLLEDWDGASLGSQERTIGRHRDSGAPLSARGDSVGDGEHTDPDFSDDPDGTVTPLDAHIRLANPRTAETADQQILRRGADFSRGFDEDGRLDQGLHFLSYQRSIRDQFAPIQQRLAGEPLTRYARTEGGGYWFVLPGVEDHDRYLGDALIEG